MRLSELKLLTHATADTAFGVDATGVIVAWNAAAEALFGIPERDAVGRPCCEVVRGDGECGGFCSPNCAVLQAVRRESPVQNFDLQARTSQGMRWCNVTVLIVEPAYSIHIFRSVDSAKRLELSVQNFLVSQAAISPEAAHRMLASPRAAVRQAVLTSRETEVLRLLAEGANTTGIANRLCLSRATVNNHVQRILGKLDAHTRLEAVRRAELAGLL